MAAYLKQSTSQLRQEAHPGHTEQLLEVGNEILLGTKHLNLETRQKTEENACIGLPKMSKTKVSVK